VCRARRSRTPSRRRVSSDRRALTGHDYRLAAVAIIDDLRSDTSEPLSAIDQILHDFGENCRPMVEQFFAEIAEIAFAAEPFVWAKSAGEILEGRQSETSVRVSTQSSHVFG
jgi:hypothetical protein